MHRVMVTLPEEIHEQLKTLAKMEGVSVRHYIAYAIARQVDAVESNAPTEYAGAKTSDRTGPSDATGLPSSVARQLLKTQTSVNQATTLGVNSVDVDHL